jgi:hypothetical protein
MVAGVRFLWQTLGMETFEIHITGEQNIINAGKSLGVKTISIDLLNPDGSFYRTEHMTSEVRKFDSFKTCRTWVENIVSELVGNGVSVHRVKIESPFYAHYEDISCYIESHFLASDGRYPLSRNRKKIELLATDRTYHKWEYASFREKV